MSLKNLEVKIGANTTGFDRGLRNVHSGIKSMTSSFATLAKGALAMAGITAGFAGLVQSVKSFVALESDITRVADIFKGSGKYITYFAENTAKAFGMAETSVYKYASTYGNLFSSITTDSVENAKVTIAMLKASAVISSKTGRTMEDVMDRIRSGLLGNTEAIEDLGVNVNVAMLEATDAFSKMADGRSWQQLSFYEQQQIRALAILEQAHTKFGDSVQKGSAFGLSVLSGAFKDLLSTAGNFINQALKPVVSWLTAIVQSATAALKSLAALFGYDISVDMSTAPESGAEAQTNYAEATNDATAALKKQHKLLAGFDELNVESTDENTTNPIVSPGKSKSPFDGITMPDYKVEVHEPDFKWLKKIESRIKGFFDITKKLFEPGIKAWVDAFAKLKEPIANTLKYVGDKISSLWDKTLAPFGSYLALDFMPNIANSFSNTFAPIFAEVMPVLLSQFTKDFDFMANQIENAINGIIKPTLEGIKIIAIDVFGSITTAWDKHGKALLDGFVKLKDGLRETWDNIYRSIIKPIIDLIGVKIGELWKEHLKPLVDKTLDFLGVLGRGLMDLWNKTLKPVLDWLVKTFTPMIKFVWDVVTTQLKNAVGFIIDRFKFMFDGLAGVVDAIVGILTGDFDRALTGIKRMFQSTIDGLINVIAFPINMLIDGLNVMIRAANGLGANIAEIPKIGGKKDEPPPPESNANNSSGKGGIQQAFATGGVVTRPIVAKVGESGKEVIMPLENNTGWIDELATKLVMRSQTQPVSAGGAPVYVYIGNDEIDNYIVKSGRNRVMKTNGRGV